MLKVLHRNLSWNNLRTISHKKILLSRQDFSLYTDFALESEVPIIAAASIRKFQLVVGKFRLKFKSVLPDVFRESEREFFCVRRKQTDIVVHMLNRVSSDDFIIVFENVTQLVIETFSGKHVAYIYCIFGVDSNRIFAGSSRHVRHHSGPSFVFDNGIGKNRTHRPSFE